MRFITPSPTLPPKGEGSDSLSVSKRAGGEVTQILEQETG